MPRRRAIDDEEEAGDDDAGGGGDESPPRAAISATFESLGLDPRLLRAVSKRAYSRPTTVQALAIPLALEGKVCGGRGRGESGGWGGERWGGAGQSQPLSSAGFGGWGGQIQCDALPFNL